MRPSFLSSFFVCSHMIPVPGCKSMSDDRTGCIKAGSTVPKMLTEEVHALNHLEVTVRSVSDNSGVVTERGRVEHTDSGQGLKSTVGKGIICFYLPTARATKHQCVLRAKQN